jgi:serine/threonine protein kinase
MGVVWRAQDELLRRTVAVKQLLAVSGMDGEEASARAMREGRIAARLQHPNAVTVYDVADVEGQPWLVMEYVSAPSLAAVLAERGKLSPSAVIRMGAQLASALAAAHAVGIVHRDVKPGNVLLAEDGTAKITDFGISRANDEAVLTATGLVCGTPAYLAPEVAKGEHPNPPSDVFALGATLYTAAEGQPPFGFGDNTLALLHIVAAGQVRPPTVTGPLASILSGLLRYDPADRPSMAQVKEVLARAAGDITTVRSVDQLSSANPDEFSTARLNGNPPPPPAQPPFQPQSQSPPPSQSLLQSPSSRTRIVSPASLRRPKRNRAGLIAGIAVVVLVVVVAGALLTKAIDRPPATSNASSTGSQSTTTTTTTPPVPEVGVNPAPKLTYLQMRAQLLQYYSLLPANTQAAFDELAPHYQKKTGGLGTFQSFYAGISSIDVKDVLPIGLASVSAVLTFTKTSGQVTHELYRFVFVIQHGKMLMFDANRVGGA